MLLIGEGRRGSSCEQSQLCHWYFGRQVARVRKKTLAEERAAAAYAKGTAHAHRRRGRQDASQGRKKAAKKMRQEA